MIDKYYDADSVFAAKNSHFKNNIHNTLVPNKGLEELSLLYEGSWADPIKRQMLEKICFNAEAYWNVFHSFLISNVGFSYK